MKQLPIFLLIAFLSIFAGCPAEPELTENTGVDGARDLSVTGVPDSIKDKKEARGDQENAKPELVVESPGEGEIIESSTVKVKVKITGDLKGYAMGKAEDGTGNHVHVILDNQPYAAHYMWDEGFELRNVTDGEHTLRMFPSRPWHESYKNEGAFRTVRFTVKNGSADETKPTVDNKGARLAAPKDVEGADMEESGAGAVDFSKPLLTYSRPKGSYKGSDANAIMIDFWLSNAKLKDEGGDYAVVYSINAGPEHRITKWEPVWLSGWKKGANAVKLWLVDGDGNAVENGGYNTTTREITVE